MIRCLKYKMKVILIFMVASCVTAFDGNYEQKVSTESSHDYIISSIDDPPIQEKPFFVYWNVPTKQCKSKKIPFNNLYEKFGIIQNENDLFEGDKITILYDEFNGLFPALLKNKTSGEYVPINGGLPQEGDLKIHLEALDKALDSIIPDKDYKGIAVIDFESWKPVLRQNWGDQNIYPSASIELEKKAGLRDQDGSVLDEKQLKASAKQRFEDSARKFMQATIARAKERRPHAHWGYYAYPYCYNMISTNMVDNCSTQTALENDKLGWLWQESAILFPSLYSRAVLNTTQLTALINGRLQEAVRFETPILPYFWFRYDDVDRFFSEEDLHTALETIFKSSASGFIIWGSSHDVNTVERCTKLLNYVENVLGPAVAKYTKRAVNETDKDGENYYLTDKDKDSDKVLTTTVPDTTVFRETTTAKYLVRNETGEDHTEASVSKTRTKIENEAKQQTELIKKTEIDVSEKSLQNITTEIQKIVHEEILEVKKSVVYCNEEFQHFTRNLNLNDMRIDTLEKENVYLMKVNKDFERKISAIEERLKEIEEKYSGNLVEVSGNIQINLGKIQIKSHT